MTEQEQLTRIQQALRLVDEVHLPLTHLQREEDAALELELRKAAAHLGRAIDIYFMRRHFARHDSATTTPQP